MNSKTQRKPRVRIEWPENQFSAEEVFMACEKNQISISRVSVHSKINRAVADGSLEIVGKSQPRTGRPRTIYKKSNGESQ